jgi:rod shape-determining protein MreC
MSSRLKIFGIILFCIVFLSLLMRLGAMHNVSWLSDGYVARVFRPVGNTLTGISQSVSQTLDHYIFLVGASEENQRLHKELELLRIRNFALSERVATMNELHQIHQDYPFEVDTVLPARVLAFDPFLTSKTILIDVGSEHGVTVNDVVLTGSGLVGRILKSFPESSQVLLLTDPSFSVDVMHAATGTRALVTGVSENRLQGTRHPFFTQVEFKNEALEFSEGDLLLSSGFGGVFPKGVPVGRVTAVDQSEVGVVDEMLVMPAVDFTKMTDVFVVSDLLPVTAEPLKE